MPGRVHPRGFEHLPALGEVDLIINATSAARGGSLPRLPSSLVGMRTAAVELSYGEVAVPFLAWARAASSGWISRLTTQPPRCVRQAVT